MKKFWTNEVKIAVAAILAFCLLFFGLRYLKGLSLFGTDSVYYVKTNGVSGLATACPVYANGFKVGTVRDIIFDYSNGDNIVVALNLDKNLVLPEGSRAEVVPSMMGGTTVSIFLGKSSTILHPGDTIPGCLNEGVLGKAEQMLPAVENVLPKLDSILAHLNAVLGNPAIPATLDNVEMISAALTSTSQELNTLLASLNKEMPSLMQSANTSMTNFKEASGHVNTLTRQLEDYKTIEKINTTLANVEAITQKIKNNEGTMGALVNDKSLYNNLNKSVSTLNATLKSTDSLVTDLKNHPKRYVHFSLFGKKEK